MGRVHLARAVGMAGFERIVAIKHCHPHLLADEEFVAMFLDEARLAARIHHPNVVPTLDVGQSDVLYLVMEYVEGDTLSRLIREARRTGAVMPVEVVLRIAMDALAGLQAAHELRDGKGNPLRVVHRDVTPQNVIVGIDGVARILDFGIATAASRSTTTKEGHVKGKLGYMAPEQLGGEDATPGTDVYALGVVMWEALTLHHLFRGNNEAETMAAVLRGQIPSLRAMRPDVTPALEAALRKAIARDPDDRYQTAAAFSEALEAADLVPASARAVGAYVTAVAGPMLEERRARLREASDRIPSARPEAETATTLQGAAPAETPKRTRGAMVATSLALALCLLGAAAYWYSKTTGGERTSVEPQVSAAKTPPTTPTATVNPPTSPAVSATTATAPITPAAARPDSEPAAEPAPPAQATPTPAPTRPKRASRPRSPKRTKNREWFPASP